MDKFAAVSDALICPLCHRPLRPEGNSLRCAKKHCFDVSQKGYVNFAPGKGTDKYSKTLFESRRAVFEDGFYQDVVQAMLNIILRRTAHKEALRILDAGCGEGYYARYIAAAMPRKAQVLAFDLSKDAIALAARGGNAVGWLVADLTNIPVKNVSMDVLLDVFTPANYAEFARALRPDGLLIKAIPGPNYLAQLRNAAGNQLRAQSHDNASVVAYFEEHFTLLQRQRVTATRPVTAAQLAAFAAMTPMLFGVDAAQLDLSAVADMTVDVELLVGKRRGKVR